jgi:hypothetical protein
MTTEAKKAKKAKKEIGIDELLKKGEKKDARTAKRRAKIAGKVNGKGAPVAGAACIVCGGPIDTSSVDCRVLPTDAKCPDVRYYHIKSCGPLTSAWEDWKKNGQKHIIPKAKTQKAATIKTKEKGKLTAKYRVYLAVKDLKKDTSLNYDGLAKETGASLASVRSWASSFRRGVNLPREAGVQ